MGLQTQLPLGVLEAVLDRQLRIAVEIGTVHGLQIELRELVGLEGLGDCAFLRVDEFQLVATSQDRLGACLWTHAHPIERSRRFERAVGLDRDLEAACVEGGDRGLVELEQGFPPVQTTKR